MIHRLIIDTQRMARIKVDMFEVSVGNDRWMKAIESIIVVLYLFAGFIKWTI